MDPLRENQLLRELASRAGLSITFKDESVLPGTAAIGELPIDVTLVGRTLVLNAVGDFGGTEKSFARCPSRGRGLFRQLYPHLVEILLEQGFEPRIYLTPLSPAWRKNYPLVEVSSDPVKGHWFYLDITLQPEPA